MKVSFILPVYKVEDYLRQCVESLLNQSFTDFEVVLVDDGSPDGCPALCDRLALKDARIKVVHKLNGGLSDARNRGVEAAEGDFVIFVDSDDFWLGKDSLKKLIEILALHPECDWLNFNCAYYYSDADAYSRWVAYDSALLAPVSGSQALCLLNASGTVPMSACLKVISREFLVSNGISFKLGQIGEDVPWFIDILDKCRCCIFSNEYIYAYRQARAGSITYSGGQKSFYSMLDIIESELQKIGSRSLSEEAKDALRSFLAYEHCILMGRYGSLPKMERPAVRKQLKSLAWLLEYTQNPKVARVSKVYALAGFDITALLLKIFLKFR